MPQINILCFKGTGLKHLQKPVFKEIKIPVPDLDIQQQIVDECATIDKKIISYTETLKQNEQKIEEIIKNLNGTEVLLGNNDLFTIHVGGDAPAIVKKKPVDKYCVPIYSNGKDEASIYGYCTDSEEKIIRGDCVSISARGTIGFVDLRKAPFLPIVRLITIQPNTSAVDIDYLKYALQKETENIVKNANGNTIQQFTKPMAQQIKIVLPNLKEQTNIAQQIKKLEEEIAKAKQDISREEQSKTIILEKYLN
jgi:restriction endonuclease S subunit